MRKFNLSGLSQGLLSVMLALLLLTGHSEMSRAQSEARQGKLAQKVTLPEGFAKTLSQAEQDLLSGNEQRRVGAAILLGKYAITQSQRLLLTVLDDPSTAVRRAAVVSLREQARFSSVADTEKFLIKLGDKDVEVRRTVSSIASYLGSQLNQLARNADPLGPGYKLPPDLKEIVIHAFSDEDDIVRLNIVKSYFRLNLVLTPDMAIDLLKDTHTEIVVATLKILGSFPLTDNLVHQIERLSKSKDRHTQVALVENLIDSKDERIVKLLLRITDADQPYLKFTHYVLMVRNGTKVSKEGIEEVTQLLSTFKKETNLLEKLLRDVHLFRSDSVNISLIHHSLLRFRLAGWSTVLKKKIGEIDNSILMQGLNDSSQSVRQTIVNFLLQSPEQVPVDLIEYMIASKIADVRVGAGEVFVRLPEAPSLDLIGPLLVDETAKVRSSALRVMVRHKPSNWQKILKRSLHDRNFTVQKQSVSQLFGTGQEGLRIIQRYRQENSQTALAQYIAAELVRRKIQPMTDASLRAGAIRVKKEKP